MTRIADEVERFFRSVHAEIEDWKFSMEDLGDGTRIFVRFQVHFNRSEIVPNPSEAPTHLTIRAKVAQSGEVQTIRGAASMEVATESTVVEEAQESGAGARLRADLDMSSFIDSWRSKRASNQGGEFHKPGAPNLDARPEWNGQKRNGAESPPDGVGRHADKRAAAPEAGTHRSIRRASSEHGEGELRTPKPGSPSSDRALPPKG
ncbi:MAG: hypothetical protein ACYDFT_00720 [Thermoplasmata archaeon]